MKPFHCFAAHSPRALFSSHRLKNTNAKTTKAMMGLSVRRRIALTGTPVQNDLQVNRFVTIAREGKQA
jgi:hypothetical protein